MSLTSTPFLLYADGNGNVFEDTSLYALGRSGWYADEVPLDDWIELPMEVRFTPSPIEFHTAKT